MTSSFRFLLDCGATSLTAMQYFGGDPRRVASLAELNAHLAISNMYSLAVMAATGPTSTSSIPSRARPARRPGPAWPMP